MIKEKEIFGSFAVRDLEETMYFYNNLLGLKLEKNQMGILELKIGESRIIIYPKPDHQPATFTVLNLPIDNIDNAVEEFSGKGIKFEHYKEPVKTDERGISRREGGPAVAWFKDPSGNILSLIQERL